MGFSQFTRCEMMTPLFLFCLESGVIRGSFSCMNIRLDKDSSRLFFFFFFQRWPSYNGSKKLKKIKIKR